MNKFLLDKLCSCCYKTRKAKFFRERLDKRSNLMYLNNTCRSCDALKSKEYYVSKKNDPKFKIKNINRVREYYEKNRDVIISKRKINHQSLKYKKYRAKYVLKNKDKISADHKIIAYKWHKNSMEKLTDSYVIGKLMQKSTLTRKDILERPQIIEIKRNVIKLKRIIKNETRANL